MPSQTGQHSTSNYLVHVVMVISHFDFCTSRFWSVIVNIVINCCFITRSTGSCQASSHNLLHWLHWLLIEYCINLKVANITFQTFHSSQPAYRIYTHHCMFVTALILSVCQIPVCFPSHLSALHLVPAVSASPLYLLLFECVPALTLPVIISKTHYFQQAFQPT